MASAAPDPLASLGITIDILQKGCELVPLPAAHVVRDGAGFAFEAFNRAYRLTGLGVVADRSPMFAALGVRLDAFLRSGDMRIDFDWQFGAEIDCRFYRVTFARTRPAGRRSLRGHVPGPDLADQHRTLAAPRDDDRQPDRPAQSRGLQRHAGDDARDRAALRGAGDRPCPVRPDQRLHQQPGGGRAAHHRRAADQGCAARPRRHGADRRRRVRHSDGDR